MRNKAQNSARPACSTPTRLNGGSFSTVSAVVSEAAFGSASNDNPVSAQKTNEISYARN
jgi:hypothetical protein